MALTSVGLALAILGAGVSAQAGMAPSGGAAATTNSELISIPHTKYVLPQNGLEVILAPERSLPIVAVNLWYHAGPLNEPQGRTGFAHLFEHLMFQGSAHVGDDAHFKLLEGAGASMINGTTDYDRTNYFQTVPSNQLELALWLESDRMGFLRSALTMEKLENQRQVVMNERRQSVENVPYGPSSERLVQLLFEPTHPYYGYVIGSMQDLAAATLDDVKDFYDAYYAPSNATMVVAGDFDEAEARELIDRYFGGLPARQRPSTPEINTEAITEERREVVTEDVALPRITMAWLTPPAYAEGDATCDILSVILGMGKSSRLYQRLVYDLQLAQSVSASQQSLALASVFEVQVTARRGVSVRKLERELEKVLQEMRVKPPTAREVTRARNILVTQSMRSLQRIGGFGGKADVLNRYNQYVGTPDYLAKDLARYNEVTAADVQALAKKQLATNKRAVVITAPKKGAS